MKNKKENKIYLNEKQKEFYNATQSIKEMLAGRGTGKSRTEGHEQYRNTVLMPRSKGILVGPTYGSLLTKTIPEIEAVWKEDYGLKEGIHYVIGQKPPANFETPLKPPRQYKNSATFFNGRCIEFASSDRPDLARGGNWDDLGADEAALIKEDAMMKVFFLAVRANLSVFGHIPQHRQKRLYTSMPWKPSGYWTAHLVEKEKKHPELYKVVQACTMDNVAILGLDYIEQLRTILPPQVYAIEVLNQFIQQLPDGFYPSFRPDFHTRIDTYEYEDSAKRGIVVKREDRDRNINAPLDLMFDFGGKINCALSAQYDRNKHQVNILREFVVKDDEGKIRELVNKICTTYSDHKKRLVRVYGEPRGNDKTPDDEKTYYQRIQKYFAANNWTAEIHAFKKATDHVSRHNFLTEIFDEIDPQFPKVRINENLCKNFTIVLQITDIKDDYTKDKTKERDPNFPQEQAPHLSDAFDYYLTQKFNHLLNSDGTFWMPNSVDFI